MSPSDLSFWDAVDALREREPRYRRWASRSRRCRSSGAATPSAAI